MLAACVAGLVFAVLSTVHTVLVDDFTCPRSGRLLKAIAVNQDKVHQVTDIVK